MKYAAIITETRYIPGDARSRTNPGHGYPATTETITGVKKFTSRDDMVKWVRTRSSGIRYTLIQYEELTVNRTITITADPSQPKEDA